MDPRREVDASAFYGFELVVNVCLPSATFHHKGRKNGDSVWRNILEAFRALGGAKLVGKAKYDEQVARQVKGLPSQTSLFHPPGHPSFVLTLRYIEVP